MSGTGYVIVMTVVIVAVYAISCWWWPFTTCWKCEGVGSKFARRDGKVWRDCRRCKGSGKRLRVGRLVWNAARAWRRAASK